MDEEVFVPRWPLRRLEREAKTKEAELAKKRLKSEDGKPAVLHQTQRNASKLNGGKPHATDMDVDEDVVVLKHKFHGRDKENVHENVLAVPNEQNRRLTFTVANKRKSGSFSYLDVPIPLPLSKKSLSIRSLHSPLKSSVPPNVRDVDVIAAETDSLHCTDTANDIVAYMRELEKRRRIPISTMPKSPNIRPHMRAILIDWLVQVEHHVKLHSGTFYMAVNLIDRYISAETVETDQYQLVGVTSLFVASKLEERYAIPISELTYLTDNTYHFDDVVGMEKKLVVMLKFSLYTSEPDFFLRRFLQCAGLSGNKTIYHLCTYLLDLVINDEIWLKELPSHLAAASLCLAMRMIKEESTWDRTMEFYTGYKATQLLPTMSFMAYCLQTSGTGRLVGAYTKYQSRSKERIATNEELTSNNPVVLQLADKNTRVKTME